MSRFFVLLAAMVMMTGCSVSSSQFSNLKNNFTNLKAIQNSVSLWRINYNERQEFAYASHHDHYFDVEDDLGTAIRFNTYMITDIEAAFVESKLQIRDKDGKRYLYENGALVATHQCSKWEYKPQFLKYVQRCTADANTYDNELFLDAEKKVYKVKQVISIDLSVMELEQTSVF